MLKKQCGHPFILVVYSICHALTAEQLLSVAAQRATCTSDGIAKICQNLQDMSKAGPLTDAQVRICKFRSSHLQATQAMLWPRDASSPRRLKVAYVSEHFHNQATSFLWQGMFRLHNYRKYDVQCFSVAQETMHHTSQLRTRMIRECGKFVDLDGQGMLQAALEINTEGIHIALGTVVNFDILDRNDVFALMP
jgi:predicted O-linked N-acetylglucosamine transferase (SPINDLY family)